MLSRQTEQEIPENRRDHAVRKTFGNAFYGGSRHTMFIKLGDVAPDDFFERAAPALDPVFIKAAHNPHHMLDHAALRNHQRNCHKLNVPAKGQTPRNQPKQPARNGGGADNRDNSHEPAKHAINLTPLRPIEIGIKPGDQQANSPYRMWQPAWVANKHIKEQRKQQHNGATWPQCPVHTADSGKIPDARYHHGGSMVRSCRAVNSARCRAADTECKGIAI